MVLGGCRSSLFSDGDHTMGAGGPRTPYPISPLKEPPDFGEAL